MQEKRKWVSTIERFQNNDFSLPRDGRVSEPLDTFENITYTVQRNTYSKEQFEKWLSSQEQNTREESTPLYPINRRVTTPRYQDKMRTSNFKKCVKDGMIVMNPYYVSKTEGEVPITFVARETVISEKRSAYAATKKVDTYQRFKRYYKNTPDRYTIFTALLSTHVTYYCVHELTKVERDIQLDTTDFTLESQDTKGEISLSNMKNRTLLSLWNEAHSGIFDLLTNLAESKETAKAITDIRKLPQLLLSYKKALKKGNLQQKLRKTVGQIGDHTSAAWLIYRLGIIPVDASIRDAIDAINKAQNIKFQTYRNGESSTMETLMNYRSTDKRFLLRRQSLLTYKVNNVIKCKLEGSSVPSLTLNVPMTLWELVPYSFVIDRFINLGDHIQRLGNRSHSVAIQGCQSVKMIENHTVELMIHPDHKNNHVIEKGNVSDFENDYSRTTTYVRVIGDPVVMTTSSLRRTLFDKPPLNSLAINFNLTTNQKLDHFALIWSYIRNKIRSTK